MALEISLLIALALVLCSLLAVVWITRRNGNGSEGPPGPAGPEGHEGRQGAQGVQGVQGLQGVQGEKGRQGERGEEGLDYDDDGTFYGPVGETPFGRAARRQHKGQVKEDTDEEDEDQGPQILRRPE